MKPFVTDWIIIVKKETSKTEERNPCEDRLFLQCVQSLGVTALITASTRLWWVHPAGWGVDGWWVEGHPESWQPDNGLLKALFLQQGPQGKAVFLSCPYWSDTIIFDLTAVVNSSWMNWACDCFLGFGQTMRWFCHTPLGAEWLKLPTDAHWSEQCIARHSALPTSKFVIYCECLQICTRVTESCRQTERTIKVHYSSAKVPADFTLEWVEVALVRMHHVLLCSLTGSSIVCKGQKTLKQYIKSGQVQFL